MVKWISVNDRLPENNTNNLVYSEIWGGVMAVCLYDEDEWQYSSIDANWYNSRPVIKYWFPVQFPAPHNIFGFNLKEKYKK